MNFLSMNSSRPANRQWIASVLLTLMALMTSPRASGQGVNERAMTLFAYHSTHNSFQIGLSLQTQLDNYNVRHLELDLRWNSDIDDFYIQHECWDDSGRGPLNGFLDQIQASNAIQTGFIVLYFNDGDIGPCVVRPSIVPKPSNWRALLQARLEQRFGDAIYLPPADDNTPLPSVQQLLRDNKHIMFVHDASISTGCFFGDDRITNTDVEATVVTRNVRGFFRHFPDWNIAPCPATDNDYDEAANNGFNWVSTNCPEDHTFDARVHPPQPTFVSTQILPLDQFGTYGRPYRLAAGFLAACNRVAAHSARGEPSQVTLRIDPGTLDLTSGTTIRATVTLTAPSGPVILR